MLVLFLVVNLEGELWVLGPAKVVNIEGLVNLEVVVNLLGVMITNKQKETIWDQPKWSTNGVL